MPFLSSQNSCFETASPQIGCAVTDQSCQCAKSKELREKVTPCVTTSCSLEDAISE
ncbi:uncharacterized protein K452DRAFT_284304 [Aplosporella prunicola CBS 121167]|uniref:CFEM domain-containing protein n=1 Tax=Aplosporella prunicola CBS 121167 TaxID=1176127 RepID=A0A6A6BLD4_9PEZI|nr:uncharacterized protein K452DRAFT_284304 [Aplosporella prunicola CBS 121167]KAF2144920.1 hypothetical protein K452DRAFT_284304 [Aplosporella prunicola CBS 121167]